MMRKKLQEVERSLSVRLLVPLLLTVVAVLTIYTVVSFRSTRERYTDLIRDGAERCSSLILGATHDGMLTNRKDQVQRTIERLSRGPGVTSIRIYDNDGDLRLAADQAEVGRHVALTDAPCRTCHERPGALPAKAIVTPPGALTGRLAARTRCSTTWR